MLHAAVTIFSTLLGTLACLPLVARGCDRSGGQHFPFAFHYKRGFDFSRMAVVRASVDFSAGMTGF